MPSTEQNGHASPDFTPVDFDIETIPPEAAPGQYEAVIEDLRVQGTSNGNYPMIVCDFKLESTASDTEEAERSIGAVIADFFPLFPDDDRRAAFPKRRLRQFCERFGLDQTLIPKRIANKSDLDEFIESARGATETIWITLQKDKQTGEDRAKVQYAAPRSMVSDLPAMEEEEEAEEERKPSRATKPAGKVAVKSKPSKSARR
jgi:hypothetical protein